MNNEPIEILTPKRSSDDTDDPSKARPRPPPKKKVIKQRASRSPLSGAENEDDDPLNTIAIEEKSADVVMQTRFFPGTVRRRRPDLFGCWTGNLA